jgi:hypothetical protein
MYHTLPASLQHCDDASGDGFGRDIATLNVRGNGEVIIYDPDDKGATERAWWFVIAPGDVWAMPGSDANGYVRRWMCEHGLPLVAKASRKVCNARCQECRISLNLRFGW